MPPTSPLPAESSANDTEVVIHKGQNQLERLLLHDTPGSHNASVESLTSRNSERSQSRNIKTSVSSRPPNDFNEPTEIILDSFSPTVAIYASPDTEELVRLKGIYGGFCGLLKPFGERIQGKVVIRDSVGTSKSWENFGIHFIEIGRGTRSSLWNKEFTQEGDVGQAPNHGTTTSRSDPHDHRSFQSSQAPIDLIIERHLQDDNSIPPSKGGDIDLNTTQPQDKSTMTAPYYAKFIRKLLANRPLVAHETLSHPVACVIAISTQSPAPIETLRDLYGDTRQGNNKVPIWVGNEFLRYYVLVHDEEHDDITKSTGLFEQMKRHFGLHCHLLRLKSVECSPENEDSVEVPACAWLSAEDELRDIKEKGNKDRCFPHERG